MKTPVALYPFCAALLPFVRHFDALQSDYALQTVAAPPGLSLSGKDAAHACNHPPVGITVEEALNAQDPSWELLLLTKPVGVENFENELFENAMESALRAGKRVCFLCASQTDITTKMRRLAEEFAGKAAFRASEGRHPQAENNNGGYRAPQAPVVLVGGLLEQADVFETLLCLASRMREDGVHPLVVAKQPICDLFGFYGINHVFDACGITEGEKTFTLNSMLKALEHAEAPDVILMEAPDAVMRYNDFDPNGFGVRSYMLCQAAGPDFFVCCVPYGLAVGKLTNSLSVDFSYRLGSPVSAVHVSNVIVDFTDLLQSRKISCAHGVQEAVRAQIEKEADGSKIPLFNVVSDGGESLYEFLRCEMTGEEKDHA